MKRIAEVLLVMLGAAFLTIIVENDLAQGWYTNITAIATEAALGYGLARSERQ